MTISRIGDGIATAIGSLPHININEALDLIFNTTPQIPSWPQLPRRSPVELMEFQSGVGFPGAIPNRSIGKIMIDREAALTVIPQFYEKILADDIDFLAYDPDVAPGLYAFADRISKTNSSSLVAVKGQLIGPVTFATSVVDTSRRAIFYDSTLLDIAIQLLMAKAKHQYKVLMNLCNNVVIFFDEPCLAAFGSAYFPPTAEEISRCLQQILEPLNSLGAITGIHCCGNTSWPLLLQSGAKVINFDSFEFFERFKLYPLEIASFLNREGILALGISPTDERIHNISENSLAEMLHSQIEELVSLTGVTKQKLMSQLLLTPACGFGTSTIDAATASLNMIHRLSEQVMSGSF